MCFEEKVLLQNTLDCACLKFVQKMDLPNCTKLWETRVSCLLFSRQ